MKKMMTSQEVADIFRVGRATVANWARQGRLKAVKVGRFWMFPREEIERVIKEGVQSTQKETQL